MNDNQITGEQKLINICINLLVICITCVAVVFVGIENKTTTIVLAWIGNFVFIYGVIVFAKHEQNVLNQYFLFYIMYYLFSYSHVFLYSIGIEYEKFNLIELYSRDLINKYIVYFILCTIGMIDAFFLACKRVFKESECKEVSAASVRIVCWLLLFISAPIYLYSIIKDVTLVYASGYRAIYNVTDSGNTIVQSMAMWCIPCLFFLIYEYKKSKLKYIFVTIMLAIIIGYLYIGSRSTPIIIMMASVLFYQTCIEKISRNKILLFCLLGLVCFIFVANISVLRSQANKTLSVYINAVFSTEDIGALVVDSIGEMGSSMQIWLRLQYLVPDLYGYRYGFSYVASVLACIPSILFGGFSFVNYAALAQWITIVENETYGLGFSHLGELYYNFGWLGIPMSIFINYFLINVLSGKITYARFSKYKYVYAVCAFCIIADIARSSMYLIVRELVYGLLIPGILIILIDNGLKKE